jgi:hypothetical protein
VPERVRLGHFLSPEGFDPDVARRVVESSLLLGEAEKTTFLMALTGAEGNPESLALVLADLRNRLDL